MLKHLLAALVLIAVGVGSAAFLASTGLISAQGGAGNTIHACVNNGGMTRIIEPTESCRTNESPLEWNVQGPPGLSGYEIVTARANLVGPFCYAGVAAKCPLGKKVLGGGGEFDPPGGYAPPYILEASFPWSSAGQDEWVVRGYASPSCPDAELVAYAICATVP